MRGKGSGGLTRAQERVEDEITALWEEVGRLRQKVERLQALLRMVLRLEIRIHWPFGAGPHNDEADALDSFRSPHPKAEA